MNIHPLVVHFPIALLVLYVFFEVLPFEQWYPRAAWKDIKTILVSFGGLGILAALATGQLAEQSFFTANIATILHLHKLFAGASAAIFGIIAAAYVIQWIFGKHTSALRYIKDRMFFLEAFFSIVLKRWVVTPLAILGFFVLAMTGVLGAIMVYGPSNDFITQFVFSALHLGLTNHP